MIKLSKKERYFTIGFIGIVLIIAGIYKFFSHKTKDWLYNPQPDSMNLMNTIEKNILLFIGVFIILNIAISIFLIVKGKKIINENGDNDINPKRKVGLYLLILPFTVLLISALVALSIINKDTFLILIACLFVFSIWLSINAIKNKAKIALIPSLAMVLIVLFSSWMLFVSPMFNKSSSLSYKASGQMNYNSISPQAMSTMSIDSVSKSAVSDNIGFSVGGAKDVNNFRENIKSGYLPLPTDVTYEGLFYDYYFDNGKPKESEKLFGPSYTYAISKDPISSNDDYYLAVGLNSNIKQDDFKRKKLNLVVVLDISGSMESPFDSYYYDKVGKNENKKNDPDEGKSKIKVASKAIVGLLDHLNQDDRIGMVVYDDDAYLAKRLGKVKDTDIKSIKNNVMELESRGGTNFEAGYKEGTKLFDDVKDSDPNEYENRIIFLTDAMPNTGDTDSEDLLNLTKGNAEKKIYTTFIGIGVDFNTELIERITKTQGANYYSVHSSADFKNRMDKEFEYMVTPLVFNLSLKLNSKGYKIEKVYGSPEANESTGEIMRVNTLFPSAQTEEGTKGGIILIKLKKLSEDNELNLSVSYEDRTGKTDSSSEQVIFGNKTSDYYANVGIRKAILLSRYADLLKNWIVDQRKDNGSEKASKMLITQEDGIAIPPEDIQLGQWERQSLSLKVLDEYKGFFKEFGKYFEEEMKNINDSGLLREKDILEKLTKE